MNEEIWAPAVGYEGRFEVSTHGRVRSVFRVICNWPSGTRRVGGGIVGTNVYRGYRRVHVGGAKNVELVHRMVALTFIPNPELLPCVNHVDGNKLNNNVSNLEWCTASENSRHAHRIGLCKGMPLGRGDDSIASKLTEAQVHEIKRRLMRGEPAKLIAKDYPVSDSAIGEIKAGRSWGHVPWPHDLDICA